MIQQNGEQRRKPYLIDDNELEPVCAQIAVFNHLVDPVGSPYNQMRGVRLRHTKTSMNLEFDAGRLSKRIVCHFSG